MFLLATVVCFVLIGLWFRRLHVVYVDDRYGRLSELVEFGFQPTDLLVIMPVSLLACFAVVYG